MGDIKVVLIGRDDLFTTCLAQAVKSFARIQHVSIIHGRPQLIRLLKTHPPEVAVLVGGQYGTLSMMDTLRCLDAHPSAIKVILLCSIEGDYDVDWILDRGISCLLPCTTDLGELEKCIYLSKDLDYYCNDTVMRLATRKNVPRLRDRAIRRLSLRELEIIKLICHDFKAKEISETLSISVKTVHSQL